MNKSVRIRLMALVLIFIMLICTTLSYAATSAEKNSEASAEESVEEENSEGSSADNVSTTTYEMSEYTNEKLSSNYTNVSKEYTAKDYDGEEIELIVDEVYKSGGKLTRDNYDYKNSAVDMVIGDEAVFKINVPETAKYFLKFDYLSYDTSILPVELALKLNGEYPFYEARNLSFESEWVDKSEKSYDRYNNEIVAIPDKLIRWESKYLMDGSYRYSQPLALELEKGENEITLDISEGSVLIGNMYLEPITLVAEYSGSKEAKGDEIIEIEAEDMTYRNDSSIRGTCEYDTNLSPLYDVNNKIMNTIDGDSFTDAGQTVTYEFEVEKAGDYYIAVNYRQADKSDFPVFLDVKIDGQLPNTQFQSYPFAYVTKYTTEKLTDEDDNNLSVYLEKGTHTISFTINIDNIRHVLETVDVIMSGINDLALEITKAAGTNRDKYRDFDLERYIPDVDKRLIDWADTLDALHDSVKIYNEKVKKIAAFSSIAVASNQLRSLAKEPNEIPYRINELSQSTSSVNQFLANLIDTLNKNQLSLDRIYIYEEDAKLPSKPGVVKSATLTAKRFVSSFMQQAYSASSTDDSHLQVWVNRSRQYLEIMQKMIDEEFTPQTGISVDLSLMPDQNKLILSNASGDAPDIATGINYSIPFDLAIRGAICDLTQFDGFKEVADRYVEGLHIPATIGDGIYAMPETMNFWVLYYRTDILDKLGLEVPDTMEDVKEMLPDLQMRGLNFFYPTAGMVSLKTFHGTTPLLFQNEASLYGKYAQDTAINSDAAIKGFTQLTELFTIYNLPKDIPNFYQHFRNGDLPIGIADYSVYNLLTNAAPEIANSWKISLVPGVEDENGDILRYTSGGAESTVMFKSNDEREKQAWEFMKWWSSTDVQSEFGQTLQITYGDEYIWNTANLEAFESLPWDTSDKTIIVNQAEWTLEAPRILGTYMLERSMSNAYNSVVVNGDNLRTTIDEAVKTVNRETKRKLEEFGYIDSEGNVIKEYEVPTLETVRRILGKTEE